MSAARRTAPAAAADLLAIVAFAALGRRNHEGGSGFGDVLATAAPFLIGYVVVATVLRLDRNPFELRRAAAVAVSGVAVGMIVRRVAFDRGTAPAFVVVALVTVTALMLGWRLIAAARGRARGTPA